MSIQIPYFTIDVNDKNMLQVDRLSLFAFHQARRAIYADMLQETGQNFIEAEGTTHPLLSKLLSMTFSLYDDSLCSKENNRPVIFGSCIFLPISGVHQALKGGKDDFKAYLVEAITLAEQQPDTEDTLTPISYMDKKERLSISEVIEDTPGQRKRRFDLVTRVSSNIPEGYNAKRVADFWSLIVAGHGITTFNKIFGRNTEMDQDLGAYYIQAITEESEEVSAELFHALRDSHKRAGNEELTRQEKIEFSQSIADNSKVNNSTISSMIDILSMADQIEEKKREFIDTFENAFDVSRSMWMQRYEEPITDQDIANILCFLNREAKDDYISLSTRHKNLITIGKKIITKQEWRDVALALQALPDSVKTPENLALADKLSFALLGVSHLPQDSTSFFNVISKLKNEPRNYPDSSQELTLITQQHLETLLKNESIQFCANKIANIVNKPSVALDALEKSINNILNENHQNNLKEKITESFDHISEDNINVMNRQVQHMEDPPERIIELLDERWGKTQKKDLTSKQFKEVWKKWTEKDSPATSIIRAKTLSRWKMEALQALVREQGKENQRKMKM